MYTIPASAVSEAVHKHIKAFIQVIKIWWQLCMVIHASAVRGYAIHTVTNMHQADCSPGKVHQSCFQHFPVCCWGWWQSLSLGCQAGATPPPQLSGRLHWNWPSTAANLNAHILSLAACSAVHWVIGTKSVCVLLEVMTVDGLPYRRNISTSTVWDALPKLTICSNNSFYILVVISLRFTIMDRVIGTRSVCTVKGGDRTWDIQVHHLCLNCLRCSISADHL